MNVNIEKYKELANEGDLRCIMELVFNYAYVYNGDGEDDREEAINWLEMLFSREEFIRVLRNGKILAQSYYAYAIELSLDNGEGWVDREKAQIYFKKSLIESPVCLHKIISYVIKNYLNIDSDKKPSKLDVFYAEELLDLADSRLPEYRSYVHARNTSDATEKHIGIIKHLFATGWKKLEECYRELNDSENMGLYPKHKSKKKRGNDNMYTPKPIDTSDVKLPKELIELTERIAENVHEVYAKSRFEEGWVYGECRDDEKKTNPTLVPYSELPESEKEYDRNTALETIKLILKLGYRLEKV